MNIHPPPPISVLATALDTVLTAWQNPSKFFWVYGIYYMSIEIYVKYSAEVKFVFHCILYFSDVKKVVSALWLVVRYFSHVKKVVWAFWLADIFLPKKFNTCSQANVNMESDFVNLLRREIYDTLSTKNLERSWRNTFVVSLRWNKPHGCTFCTKTNRQMVRKCISIRCGSCISPTRDLIAFASV